MYSNGTLTKYSESFSDYTELIRDYCNNYVCGKDRVKVRRESDINNIIRRINESGPYQVNYQMNDGEWRGLKFMPVKDEYNDNLFMAGVVIFDKEMQNYQRVKNLQETISGLTETYQMICRVNLDLVHEPKISLPSRVFIMLSLLDHAVSMPYLILRSTLVGDVP